MIHTKGSCPRAAGELNEDVVSTIAATYKFLMMLLISTILLGDIGTDYALLFSEAEGLPGG